MIAFVATIVALVTIAGADPVLRSSDPGTAFERDFALVLILTGILLVGTTAACWVLLTEQPRVCGGLAVALIAVCVPWWAGWSWLPGSLRAAALAVPVLAAPALSGATVSWSGHARLAKSWQVSALAAASSAVLHAAAYNPLGDLDCLRTCRGVDIPVDPSAARILLESSRAFGLLAVGAAMVAVGRRAGPAPLAFRCCVGVALATLGLSIAAGPAVLVAGHAVPVDLPAAATTMVAAIAAAMAMTRIRMRRRAVEHLIRQLQAAEQPRPGSVAGLDLGSTDTTGFHATDLTPVQLLALDSARLTARTRHSLEEARAAQRQAITRTDDERWRLERDLHDGAQQQLVTAALHLSVAATHSPSATAEMLDEARTQVLTVLGELRRLSHGPFPRVLVEEGLGAAVEELGADHGSRVSTGGDLTGLDPAVVRAAYRVLGDLLAGLGADGSVSLARLDATLSISATSSSPVPPLVLSGDTADRIEALGGRVLTTEAGSGHRMEVEIPCA